MVGRALDIRGAIDVLVNNAGLVERTPLLDLDETEWNRVVGVNLTGAYLCSRAVARVMVSTGTRGSIVHIGSIHATRSLPGRSHYAASKAGLVAMNRVMAYELAEHGIRCNVVNPGATYSESWGGALEIPAEVRRVEASIPLGRIGTPADVAGAVMFFLSPAADYITGASLDVDGGLLTSPTHV
jgi:3-oxoacyl-[acyl-carrier protein] reductase